MRLRVNERVMVGLIHSLKSFSFEIFLLLCICPAFSYYHHHSIATGLASSRKQLSGLTTLTAGDCQRTKCD